MDSAFKRRWEFEYISVNEPEQVAKIEKYVIPMCANTEQGYYVNWNDLRTRINSILIDNCKVNEDKLLGPFFISKNVLDDIKANKDEKDRILAIVYMAQTVSIWYGKKCVLKTSEVCLIQQS